MAGHWSKHRFKIFNATQHPYRHNLSEFAYTSDGLPGVTNVEEAMNWLISTLYPLTQSAVALKTDLPSPTAITFDGATGKIVGAPAAFKVGDEIFLTSSGNLPTSYIANSAYRITVSDVTGLTVTDLNGNAIPWTVDDGSGTHTINSIANAYRVVFDDGDGKAASYRWEQREGDASPKWYKIYDMDWSQDSILAQFENITQDLYVYKYGKNDTDDLGAPLAGDEAGQHVYGGKTSNTNLTLHANSGDAVGIHSGEIRTDDQVVPTVDNLFDLGKLLKRYKELFLSLAANIDTMKIESGKITDSTGTISFDDEDLSSTGDLYINDVTATGFVDVDSSMHIQAGSITDVTGAISFGDENLTTTGSINAKDFILPTGGKLQENGAGSPQFTSPSGFINFNNLTLEDIALAIMADLTATTADIANFNFSGSNILTITPADVNINSGVGFKVVIGPKLETPELVVTGSATVDSLTVSTDLTVNDDLTVLGDTNLKNTIIDGTIDSPLAEINVLKDMQVPNLDVTGDTSTATLEVTTSVTLGAASTITDGTNTANSTDILDFPFVASAQNDVPHWDTATNKYIAKQIDFPDHGELVGLTDDDHPQYVAKDGRAGGQTVAGSDSATAGNLTLVGQAGNPNANKIIVQDKVVPNTAGVDLGSPTEAFGNIYSSGQHYGFRFENVATLPTASVANTARAVYNTTEQKAYLDLGGSWKALGSGSGGDSANIFTNGDAEDISYNLFETNGYDDGIGQTVPLIGGVINTTDLSTSISTVNPLNGTQCYRLQKTVSGSNWQGKGFRTKTVNLPLNKRAKLLKISFDYMLDAPSVTTCPFAVYFYDITNAKLVYPTTQTPPLEASTLVSSYQGEVQFDYNTTQVRMLLHFGTSVTGQLVDIRLDDLKLVANQAQSVNNSTEPTLIPTASLAAGQFIKSLTGTQPTYGTIDTNQALVWREGEFLCISGSFRQTSVGSAGTGIYGFDLQALGYSINTAKVKSLITSGSQLDFGPGLVGEFKAFSNDAGQRAEGGIYVYDSTKLKVAYMLANNSTGAAGFNIWGSTFGFNTTNLQFSYQIKVPVLGVQNASKASDGYDGRAIITRATRASAAITAGATIASWTTAKDNTGSFNATTGEYTVKSAGDFFVNVRSVLPTSGSTAISIYKNGTVVATGTAAVAGSTRGSVSALLDNLIVGDIITIRGDASVTLSSEIALDIFKLQSPQTITSGEIIALRYSSTSGATIGTTDATYVYGNKSFDTHGAYNSSTGEFTAPVSATYKVKAQLATTYSAANHTLYVRIYKNGVLYSSSYVSSVTGSAALTTHEDYIELAQGDKITIRAMQNVSAAAASSAGINFLVIERV